MTTLRKFIYSWYISVAHIKSLFKRPSNRSIYIPQGSDQFTLKGTLLSTLVYNSKSTAVLAYFLYNLEIFALLHVKVTILVAFYYAFKAYNSGASEAISTEFLRLRKTHATLPGVPK